MPREMNSRDWEILKVLAPEYESPTCAGSGHAFQSILPPVSNHFATDERDFEERLRRLSTGDLQYLVDHILDGSESLGCVQEEDVETLITLVGERISHEAAQSVFSYYSSSGVCEQ